MVREVGINGERLFSGVYTPREREREMGGGGRKRVLRRQMIDTKLLPHLIIAPPGPLGAGKTSLMLRYIYDTFEDKISRFVSEEKKSVTINGKEIVLDIWDTAGIALIQNTSTCIHMYMYVL